MSEYEVDDQRSLLERHQAALLELARFEGLQSDDQELALRILVDVAARTLNVERSSIWLFDEERSKITCIMLFERSTRSFSKGHELLATDVPSYFAALAENRALAADDARNDPRMIEIAPIYLEPLGITSMLDAPIRLGGRVAGIVCNEHTGAKRIWSLEEQNFAASISDMAAITLEHSDRVRAEAEVQRRDDMLDGVAKAANRMFANAERDLAYQEALLATLASITRTIVCTPGGIGSVLQQIGTALGADCVAQYGSIVVLASAMSSRADKVWTIDGVERELALEIGPGLPTSWIESLTNGVPVGSSTEQLSSNHAAQFLRRGVRSLLLAPIEGPRGFGGLLEVDVDVNHADREWTRSEQYFLKACGLLLGSM